MRLWLAIVCFFRVLFGRPLPAEVLPPVPPPAPLPPPAPPPPCVQEPSPELLARHEAAGARAMLRLLQEEGRFLDFLMEPIDGYDDAQVGAAVRAIHGGCRKALAAHVPLEPVLAAKEEERVTVERGFDPRAIRLTGNVAGDPPFTGTLKHHGWRASSLKLPRAGDGESPVVAPAEVEL